MEMQIPVAEQVQTLLEAAEFERLSAEQMEHREPAERALRRAAAFEQAARSLDGLAIAYPEQAQSTRSNIAAAELDT